MNRVANTKHALRIGSGATVPVSYVQSRLQQVFADVLYRLAPQTTSDLLTEENLTLEAQVLEADIECCEVCLLERDGQLPDEAELHARNQALKRAIADSEPPVVAWQRRYSLPDDWVYWAARSTLGVANLHRQRGSTYQGPLIVENPFIDVHDGLEEPPQPPAGNPFKLRFIPEHKLRTRAVYLDHLRHPTIDNDEGYWEDEGEFGVFEPRKESVDRATDRLLEELRPRLRAALQRMEDEDMQLNNAMKPVEFRKITAFEWLVRFQVLGESRAGIARQLAVERGKDDPHFYRSHVGREIRRVADLIGLTPRDHAETT